MKKRIYNVRLIKDQGGHLKALFWKFDKNTAEGDNYWNDIRLEEAREYEKECENADEVKYTLTTEDYNEALSHRINCECAELRDLVEYHKTLYNYKDGSPVLDATYDMCIEVQKMTLDRIGRQISRLRARDKGVDYYNALVKDELADKCRNYYNTMLDARMTEQNMLSSL